MAYQMFQSDIKSLQQQIVTKQSAANMTLNQAKAMGCDWATKIA